MSVLFLVITIVLALTACLVLMLQTPSRASKRNEERVR